MESQPESEKTEEETSIVQERLNWKIAWRDDAKVAQGLYAGEEIEEMHELSRETRQSIAYMRRSVDAFLRTQRP